ncbi:MAG: 50S ribosomal protein L4 [Rhodospirillales bacterium]
MKLQVHNLDQEAVGDLDLADEVFALPPRADILARMVTWQLAKRRQGSHKVKGRSEVVGSGRKLFRQKGSGNARMGNSRTPIRRGGGVAHGPQVRSHAHDLPKKVRRLALKTALSAKVAEGKVVVLDQAKLDEAKTKALKAKFAAFGWDSVLIIDGSDLDEGFARAARNLPKVDVLPQQGANVHDILRHQTLVLTRDAVAALEARLK